MKRVILIAAGVAVLAIFVLYWRAIIFHSMTMLVVGLHNPLVLLSIVAAAMAVILLWARRRAPRISN